MATDPRFRAIKNSYNKTVEDVLSQSYASIVSTIGTAIMEELGAANKAVETHWNTHEGELNAKLAQAYSRAGFAAQAATVARYRATLINAAPSGYRANDSGVNRRYSGGQLEDALSSNDFFDVRGTSIRFGNQEMLDRRAKQWHRLNFGTGVGSVKTSAPIRFEGKFTGINLGWTRSRSKSFEIPRGIFLADGSFYPADSDSIAEVTARASKESGFRIIKGRMKAKDVIGKGFLDAGVVVLAQEISTSVGPILSLALRDSFAAGGKKWSSSRRRLKSR